jgi:uncharacterized protein (TIGR03437 family)
MKKLFLVAGLCTVVTGAWAQQFQYRISTIAGGAPPLTPFPAFNSSIGAPVATATDSSGNPYFVGLNCVFRVDQTFNLNLVAGNSTTGYSGDGGPAKNAQLNGPTAITLDAAGNLYIADASNYRVRRVSPTGIITTVAGNGTQGYSGDNGSATKAQLNGLAGIAVDGNGNLYFSDKVGSWIRKVSPAGIITTIAGTGSNGYSGDNVPALGAQLYNPTGIAVDGSGNVYIADSNNFRIRMISAGGTITTVAGSGAEGYFGDGGQAVNARFNGLAGIAVDGAGDLFIADTFNARIREVGTNGVINTVAGSGSPGFTGDGAQAILATMNNPVGVAVDGSGNIFIVDRNNYRIRKVAHGGVMGTLAGNGIQSYSGDGGPATAAQMSQPTAVAVDGSGNVYVADTTNSVVRVIAPAGVITTLAGTGIAGFSGDSGQAIGAQLNRPSGVAVDSAGNVYIADTLNSRIRKILPSGVITTVAGGGSAAGEGVPATNAVLSLPQGVAVDPAGNLFISDTGTARIREVSAADGTISTVAGNGTPGYSGDAGPATSAQLNSPFGIAVDAGDNIVIADSGNNVIRKVSGGNISTIAGNGIAGYSGDGGQGVNAQLATPYAVALDISDNIYVADYGNSRIREVTTGGTISTVTGTGTAGYSGDGGPAVTAQVNTPTGVAVDGSGNVYVVDSGNGLVRKLLHTFQLIMTGAVLDAASESASSVSPGQIMVIYGAGLGPATLVENQPVNGVFGTQVAGTTVAFNGQPGPMIYTSATQVAAIAPYNVSFSPNAQVTVSYQNQTSTAITLPVAASAPAFFTANQSGAGQAAVLNPDGTPNDATHPAAIGSYIAMFATGEGQTSPAGVDGKLALTTPYPAPLLQVKVFVGGAQANVVYAATAPTEVAGLFQVNIQIPAGVQPGGYVPVVLQVGNNSTVSGAVWIAVSAN